MLSRGRLIGSGARRYLADAENKRTLQETSTLLNFPSDIIVFSRFVLKMFEVRLFVDYLEISIIALAFCVFCGRLISRGRLVALGVRGQFVGVKQNG